MIQSFGDPVKWRDNLQKCPDFISGNFDGMDST
jgi:hypothetical protein